MYAIVELIDGAVRGVQIRENRPDAVRLATQLAVECGAPSRAGEQVGADGYWESNGYRIEVAEIRTT